MYYHHQRDPNSRADAERRRGECQKCRCFHDNARWPGHWGPATCSSSPCWANSWWLAEGQAGCQEDAEAVKDAGQGAGHISHQECRPQAEASPHVCAGGLPCTQGSCPGLIWQGCLQADHASGGWPLGQSCLWFPSLGKGTKRKAVEAVSIYWSSPISACIHHTLHVLLHSKLACGCAPHSPPNVSKDRALVRWRCSATSATWSGCVPQTFVFSAIACMSIFYLVNLPYSGPYAKIRTVVKSILGLSLASPELACHLGTR